MASANDTEGKKSLVDRLEAWWLWATVGVWHENEDGSMHQSRRRKVWVATVKIVNLTIRSFVNGDIQSKAASLTYQTLLAMVPAMALLFAIGRGFGFQSLLQSQLFSFFPAQRKALEAALRFVDGYLSSAQGEGIFVAVGLGVLLWTLLSLMWSVEDTFNEVWGVSRGRTLWRRITDYTAMCLLLPLLMIAASGITVLMTTADQDGNTALHRLSPYLGSVLDWVSLLLVWLFFAGVLAWVPNTRVRFGNAMISGILTGTAVMVLQWLFVSGQVYVTRYNAIYGSFAFLPLLLVWLQLVWVITLTGSIVCYSSQNIFEWPFTSEIGHISSTYRWRLNLAVMAVVCQRFAQGEKPATMDEIVRDYGLPSSVVRASLNRLRQCELIRPVAPSEDEEDEDADKQGFVPSTDTSSLTVGRVWQALVSHGAKDFVPHFNEHFAAVSTAVEMLGNEAEKSGDATIVASLTIHTLLKN